VIACRVERAQHLSEEWFLGSAANMLGHQLREIGADNDNEAIWPIVP